MDFRVLKGGDRGQDGTPQRVWVIHVQVCSRCRGRLLHTTLFRVFCDQAYEGKSIDRFGRVIVAPRIQASLAVGSHRMGGLTLL